MDYTNEVNPEHISEEVNCDEWSRLPNENEELPSLDVNGLVLTTDFNWPVEHVHERFGGKIKETISTEE